jgi:hypothetical protein
VLGVLRRGFGVVAEYWLVCLLHSRLSVAIHIQCAFRPTRLGSLLLRRLRLCVDVLVGAAYDYERSPELWREALRVR